VVVEVVMELRVQTLKLMPLTEVQEEELGQFQEEEVVVLEQVTPLQLPHLKAVMEALVIEMHQHTLTEVVVVEHPQ
tara:strand:+ start:103 stop:330 length:228 start_codon:yes stop_codon:yes gene_type:complete